MRSHYVTDVSEAVIALPRGGLYVRTSAGPIQFGVPPETIKDSMALGLAVPTVYVVPSEPFDRRRGINVAECEFPAYYNFFLRKLRVRLVVDDAAMEARIRTVFSLSLFGPAQPAPDSEFVEGYPSDHRPDLQRESNYFRRTMDGERHDVDTLLDFVRFDRARRAEIGPGVVIERLDGGGYVVRDQDAEVAKIPERLVLPPRTRLSVPSARPFEPPDFGVTVLGASHGFDPQGRTTGFILWIGRRGILVDPPVDATDGLRELGVPPKLIDGVILTHGHADHDSGTFQKILEENRIDVYTTPTVMGAFLKKYSALSGIGEDVLRRLFMFHPAKIGAPVRVHGAEIWFFYTLHSIPCVGFEVFYGGKSIAFSADSLYDPRRIREMQTQGVLARGRAEDLIGFPWHHSVVLHEAGLPPLHTPVEVLASLSEETKSRLYVVHIAEKDVPEGSGLRSAKPGLEHTIRIDVPATARADTIEMLDTLCSVDIFRDFPISRAREFLHAARRVKLPAGDRIIAQGTVGDRFYIVANGTAAVVQNGKEVKTYHAGDYFGETALILGQPRNADVIAATDVSLIELDRYDFLYLLRGTDIPQRLVRLARMRAERSWEVIEHNSVFRAMTSAQKTSLQSYLESRAVRADEVLWWAGNKAEAAYIVEEGSIALEGGVDTLEPFAAGAFVGEVDAMRQGMPLSTTARVIEPGRVFQIDRDDLNRFFQDNPGVLLSFLGTKFVE